MRKSEHGNVLTSTKCFHPFTLARFAAANLGVLLVLYALAEGVGEWYWLTLLFAYCPPLLWTPVTILLTLAATARRNTVALGWCTAAWLLLLPVLGLHLPLNRPSQDANDLRVLTFNIESGQYGVRGVVETIRRTRAEVVLLEEVNGHSGIPDPLPALRAALPEYTIIREREVALATRLPLRKTWSVPLPYGRRMVFGEVVWRGRTVTVAAVHFSVATNGRSLKFGPGMPSYLRETATVRKRQADVLLAECARISGPLVVAGDFNTPPRGPLYRRLTGNLRDSFADAGLGFGWSYSAERPCLRIDYVFTSPDIRASRCFVLRDHTSDHRPVLAFLKVPGE